MRTNSARSAALLLTALTVATAGVVLWLVLHTIRTERQAEQARWKELTQQRLEAGARRVREAWQEREAAVLQLRDLPPPEAFAAVVRDGLADSAIFSRNSRAAYPALVERDAFGELEMPSHFAEALESLREKLKAKDYEGALHIAQEFFSKNRGVKGLTGRDIALAADLMLLTALRHAEREVPGWLVQRMTEEVKNYRDSSVPSPQRRLLMQELAGTDAANQFPTWRAEFMAQNVLSGLSRRAVDVIEPAGSGVRLIFDLGHLHRLLSADAADANLVIMPPDMIYDGLTADLHPSLPGWRASTSAGDVNRQSAVFTLSVAGGAATFLLSALTFLTWRQVQRQMRRAQLQEDLAATVSHELRTPVASMRVLAESLLEERNPAPEKTREYLQLIAGENARLSRLIENFLTLARLERKPGPAAGTVRVAEIMERVTAAAGAHASRIHITGVPPVASVRIEPAALETALLNLLDNACKYSPPDSPVEWSAAREGAMVVFEVLDHGAGLSREASVLVWQPFERGDATGPGCGLGLAIVKRIAEQAGGSAAMENMPGGGCRFRLSLPAVMETPA